jgi:hypothetical protein
MIWNWSYFLQTLLAAALGSFIGSWLYVRVHRLRHPKGTP